MQPASEYLRLFEEVKSWPDRQTQKDSRKKGHYHSINDKKNYCYLKIKMKRDQVWKTKSRLIGTINVHGGTFIKRLTLQECNI